jgi:hypothetical protein
MDPPSFVRIHSRSVFISRAWRQRGGAWRVVVFCVRFVFIAHVAPRVCKIAGVMLGVGVGDRAVRGIKNAIRINFTCCLVPRDEGRIHLVLQEGGAAVVAVGAAVAAGEVRKAAVCPGEDLVLDGRLRLEAGPVGSVEATAATG